MAGTTRVVVLGGGLCGLYAARVLSARGVPVTVVEREAVAGGLAAGTERGGNHYDLGVHHLHAFDEGIFRDIRSLLGDRLRPSDLRALILTDSGFRRYPLEVLDIVRGMPLSELFRSAAGFALQRVRGVRPRPAPRDAEDALVRMYGRPLYEGVFRDFTRSYWGLPASGLSAEFVRTRMPRLGPRRKGSDAPGALQREVVWSTPAGAGEIPLALAAKVRESGGEILLKARVVAVETGAGRADTVHVEGEGGPRRIPCTDIISTIPLPDLVGGLVPRAPSGVLEASARLRYRAVAVFGLLVRKPRVFDAEFVHFRRRVFHRVGEPKHCGLEVRPPDHSVLIAEMTCAVGDEIWRGEESVRRRVVGDLEDEGALLPGEVVEIHHLRASHGYPIYALGFEADLATVGSFLKGFGNLHPTGRQGGFGFPGMHSAMRMGAAAAERIVRR